MGETLGSRIQALRKTAGLTQSELGEKTGLGLANVRNWEQDRRVLSVFALFKIARALGLPMERFLAGVDGAEEPSRPAPGGQAEEAANPPPPRKRSPRTRK